MRGSSTGSILAANFLCASLLFAERIEVDDGEGEGSSVVISLPRPFWRVIYRALQGPNWTAVTTPHSYRMGPTPREPDSLCCVRGFRSSFEISSQIGFMVPKTAYPCTTVAEKGAEIWF